MSAAAITGRVYWPSSGIEQPVPRTEVPPGVTAKRLAHDFECNDPRHGQTEGYWPRTWKQAVPVIPEAFQLEDSTALPMTREWSEFSFQCYAHYCPKHLSTDPPFDLDQPAWAWLHGFVPQSAAHQWYIHLMHSQRCITNYTGPDVAGYGDPFTGYVTPDSQGRWEPFKVQSVTTGGNRYWSGGSASGGKDTIWCLDGYEAPPTLEQVVDEFCLLHILTQCNATRIDKTPRENCPNGTFGYQMFPQAMENIVVHPMVSRWKDGDTMMWNGLHLRTNRVTTVRVLAMPEPAWIPWPSNPARPMIVEW